MAPNNKKIVKLIKDLKKCSIAEGETAEDSGIVIEIKQVDQNLISMKKWPAPKQKVPDIFLHKPVDFKEHVKKLLLMGIKFFKPYLGRYYTKIACATMNDHKALVQYFEKKNLPFNTFGNLAKRKMKVVIKGLPKDVDLNLLKSELKSQDIPIVRVHKMKDTRKGMENYPKCLVLAVVPCNDDGKKLLLVENLLGSKVTMEPPKPKAKQCHRCQMWGHTQRYCHGQVKCVKCAGEHLSKKCERDREKEPPKCANCGGEHTASYRKCPCCPESQEHKMSQLVKHFNRNCYEIQDKNEKTELVTLENCDSLYKNETTCYETDNSDESMILFQF